MPRPLVLDVTDAHAALVALGSSEPALKAMRRLYAYRVAEEVGQYSLSELVDFLLGGSSAIDKMSAEDLADVLTDDLKEDEDNADGSSELDDVRDQAASLVAEFTAHVAESARREAESARRAAKSARRAG